MKKSNISIAIVDDHTLFRSGLASLLSEFEEIEVVLQAANGEELQNSLKLHPGIEIILMDINMPVMDGYTTTSWVKKNYPKIRVLALSMYEDEKAIIKMLKAGAVGYMLKESKPVELLEALKTIQEKGIYINDLVSGRLLISLQQDKEANLQFTNKELEFLQLCSTELTYKEIASIMNVSPRTVDNYRESLFLKLNIKSRTGLVVHAIKAGMIQV